MGRRTESRRPCHSDRMASDPALLQRRKIREVHVGRVRALRRKSTAAHRTITLGSVKGTADLVQPSRKEFLSLSKEHTLVPVCRTLTADLETPVSAFLRTAWQERECFLLESVEGGEQLGRYTFIGVTPYKRIVARGREIAITEGKRVTRIEGDIFKVLRDALGGHKPARLKGLPPFTAGAVGYFRLRCSAPDRAAAFAGQRRTRRARRLPAVLRRGAGLRSCAQGDLAGGNGGREARSAR